MELFRALACVAEPPSAESRRVAAAVGLGELPDDAAWHDLFVLQLVPYASVYLGAEGMLGGEARDRIAGTWRAIGLAPPDEPDHLAVLLSAYASLREEPEDDRPGAESPSATSRERRRHLARVFLWEHLLSWLPAYLQRARELADGGYRRWGELLRSALAAEAAVFPPPPELPLALRAAPAMADPRQAGGERFVASLLAPAASGLVLARADLERLGRELGLGVRRGERAYALKALLSQDGPATLAWLAAFARRSADEHRADEPVTGPLARAWAGRARAAARLLEELGRDLDRSTLDGADLARADRDEPDLQPPVTADEPADESAAQEVPR